MTDINRTNILHRLNDGQSGLQQQKSLEGRDWNRTENGIISHEGREGVTAKVLVAERSWGRFHGYVGKVNKPAKTW